jgi:hypothetical protein
MNTTIDRSHDPELNSHVKSANLPGIDFPIRRCHR